MAEVIDSHHHFWNYSKQDYGWIRDNMKAIQRDFLPADLEQELKKAKVDGAISVQARQTIAETEWLLQHAKQHKFLRGVVGWLPLTQDGVESLLKKFSDEPKFRGVRHVLQDEKDDGYPLRKDFDAGIAALEPLGLTYDILIVERQLPQAIKLVDRHPKQTFILDHVAKPKIKDLLLQPWQDNIKAIAKRENVYCKVSGMVTEANWQTWSESDLEPYLATVLEAFGPRRLMFGSDWPVCLVASDYSRWVDLLRSRMSKLSITEQDQIFGLTATKAYRLRS